MDLLSSASAAAAMIVSCVKIGTLLYCWIEEIGDVDVKGTLKAFMAEVNTLSAVLDAFKSWSQDTVITDSTQRQDNKAIWVHIQKTLQDCSTAIDQLDRFLRDIQSKRRLRPLITNFRLMLKSDNITHIRQQIQSYTTVLQMAMQLIYVNLSIHSTVSSANASSALSLKLDLLRYVKRAESLLNRQESIRSLRHGEQEYIVDERGLERLEHCTKIAQSVFSSTTTVITDTQSTRAGARESYISVGGSDYGGVSDHTRTGIEKWILGLAISEDGNAGGGDGGSGAGGNDGGGGGEDSGDDDNDDGWDFGRKKNKKNKKTKKQEEEERKKGEEDAATTNGNGRNFLNWADDTNEANIDDDWTGFTTAKKKKGKKDTGAAATAAPDAHAISTFPEINFDDSPPNLNFTFGANDTKTKTTSGGGFEVWDNTWDFNNIGTAATTDQKDEKTLKSGKDKDVKDGAPSIAPSMEPILSANAQETTATSHTSFSKFNPKLKPLSFSDQLDPSLDSPMSRRDASGEISPGPSVQSSNVFKEETIEESSLEGEPARPAPPQRFGKDITPFDLGRAVEAGPVPFSDSGYASGTHGMEKREQNAYGAFPGSGDMKIGTSMNEESVSRSVIYSSDAQDATSGDLDDSKTIYSDGSSTMASVKEKYISELAEDLLENVLTHQMSDEDGSMERLYSTLPRLLKAFARKIGQSAKSQESRDVMVFVSKHRNTIVARLKEHFITQEAKHHGADPTADEKISDWFRRDEVREDYPTELFVGVEDLPKNDSDDHYTHAKLPPYREFIVGNPAYTWLIKSLHRDLVLTPTGPNIMQTISDTILDELSRLAPFRYLSRNRGPHLCKMEFQVNWNPLVFVEEQEYEEEPEEAIERAITLTGAENDAQALTTAHYLRQSWPLVGEETLDLLKDVIRNSSGSRHIRQSRDLKDGTRLTAWIQDSKVSCQVFGTIDSVAEIGEQLAWLGAALRSSPKERGIVYCCPFISALATGTPDPTRFWTPASCNIDFEIETRKDTATPPDGQCWHDLFRNPVVVKGYPIQSKSQKSLGLEVPLNMMATLAGARRIVTFAGNLLIKGFSTMLLVTKQVGDIVVWHLLFNEDGEHISYEDPRVRAISASNLHNISTFELESVRHVLGWCSEVTSSAGAPNANYKIKWSGLPKPHQGCAFEKVSISGGKFISAGVSFAIGKKDKPVYIKSRDDYVTQLKWVAKKFVILYDLRDRRAWLVDGLSGLLHLVRASLENDQSDAFTDLFLFQRDRLKEADPARVGQAAAISVLTNNSNKNLRLYQKPDDDYDEETTMEDGGREKVTKKRKTYLCFKDRVEQIYHLLEQIIAYQSQVDSDDGIGFRVKYTPRRQLEGFEFMDVATDEDPFWPRVATLRPTGTGWVDFARAIHAVTFFGYGFGDILKPLNDSQACSSWMEVPKGFDYLAVCVSDLNEILDKKGSMMTNPWRLVDDIYWHNPDKVFEPCQYTNKTSSHKRCGRVQVLLPARFPNLWARKFRSPSNLGNHGAVIFGHNWKFPLRWGDYGEPKEGDPSASHEDLTASSRDSGLGSSIDSSSQGASNNMLSSNSRSLNQVSSGGSQSSATPARGSKKLSALDLFRRLGRRRSALEP